MSKTPWQAVLVVLALFLFLPSAATAQEEKPSHPQPSGSQNAKAAKAPGMPPLRSVTLVNTTEAARKVAAEESARRQLKKDVALTPKQPQSGKTADGAVLEFQPTDGTPATNSSQGTFQVKDSKKKPLLKNIHGSAYGAAASGVGRANGEAGAVGADSRGGKFNVYVEGEHTHDSTPGPH
jgi:hypothetical protein